MEAEIWQWLPKDFLFMTLARLPIRVLGKMRTVCKQWNYLLSSRDALQVSVPKWSLHSTPGFLIEIQDCNMDGVEYWVIEGCGSDVYILPLANRMVLDTCNGICFCRAIDDHSELSIGIPGTGNWRGLPHPPVYPFGFNAMAFDSSTGRCTLMLGHDYIEAGYANNS